MTLRLILILLVADNGLYMNLEVYGLSIEAHCNFAYTKLFALTVLLMICEMCYAHVNFMVRVLLLQWKKVRMEVWQN